jgi:uncharacterized protein (TIRG00374 family)
MPHFASWAFQRLQRSAFVKLALKLGLTFLALWFAFHEVDFVELKRIFYLQELWPVFAAYILLNIQAIFAAIRWRMVLAAVAKLGSAVMPMFQAIKITYIGSFFGVCLPGTVGGDVVRVWLTKLENIPLSTAIHVIIIDRVIALVGLGLMIVFALPALGGFFGFDGYWLTPLVLALGIAGLWLLLQLGKLLEQFNAFRIVRVLIYFISSIRLLLSHRKICFLSLLYAVIGHVMFCWAAVVLASSLSMEFSLAESLILIPPVVLLTTLPISIGGWGVRETAMIAMLSLIGISQEAALMLSIELGILNIINSLPGGAFWMSYRKRKGKADLSEVNEALQKDMQS